MTRTIDQIVCSNLFTRAHFHAMKVTKNSTNGCVIRMLSFQPVGGRPLRTDLADSDTLLEGSSDLDSVSQTFVWPPIMILLRSFNFLQQIDHRKLETRYSVVETCSGKSILKRVINLDACLHAMYFFYKFEPIRQFYRYIYKQSYSLKF
jgi:hypothetical protein